MMRFALPSVVLLLVVLKVSWGLPPVRRFGYDTVDSGYHRGPAALGTPGLAGSRFGAGYRGLGDSNWCPLRAREALRPVQRFPTVSRTQGPGYFNYAFDDEAQPRYGRSHRANANIRPINDLNDVDNPNLDNEGVNVGGVLWPRQKTPPVRVETLTQDCGCDHQKVATLAKDATAAAANAATAAARAARAAAEAAAAAACHTVPNYKKQDGTESDESSAEINPDVPLEYRVEYPDNFQDDNYQGEQVHSQGSVDSRLNLQDISDNGEFLQGTTDSEEFFQGPSDNGMNTRRVTEAISLDTADNEDFSQGNGRIGLNSWRTTGSRVKTQDFSDNGEFFRGNIGGRPFSQDRSTTESDVNSRRSSGTGVKSQGTTYSADISKGITESGISSWRNSDANLQSTNERKGFPLGTTGSDVISRKTIGTGVNSQSTAYSADTNHGSTVTGVNSRRNAGGVVNSQGTNERGEVSQGAKGSGTNSRGTTSGAVNSRGTTVSAVNSQGTSESGVKSQVSTGNGPISEKQSSSWSNSKIDKTPAEKEDIPSHTKKNLTTTDVSNSNVQRILPHVDENNL